MVLIQCKECGNEVSKNAESCPKCGEPVKKQPKQNMGVVHLILISIVDSLIAASIFFYHGGSFKPSDPDPFQIVKVAVESQLSDPTSVLFRGIEKRVFGYCGEVNAKNRMGGYVGYKKFHALEGLVS